MDTKMMHSGVLALADQAVVPVSAVLDAARELRNEGVELSDPLIITQASSLSQLPVESSSMNLIISISRSPEFPGDQLYEEFSRVLKPGGAILIHKTSQSATSHIDQATSSLERKLLMAGFVEAQVIQLKTAVPSEGVQSFGIKAKKPSWKIGSSFSIKNIKSLPKVQIDDDMDLIDEDSLLTEDDLKKPQLPPVSDCEFGSTRKACKNCSCGMAEAEENGQKLGLTMDKLNNPQSACGSCGLGDAFRCGSCPYKGLPPFKLGEKVSLPGNFLVADI